MIKYNKIIIIAYPLILIGMLYFLYEEYFIYSIVILSCIVFYELIIYYKLSAYGIRGIWILSPPALVYVSFTVFIGIPSVYIISTTNNPQAMDYFFSIVCFYIFYPLGLFIGTKIFPHVEDPIKLLDEQDWGQVSDVNLIYELLIVLLSVIVLSFLLYLYRVDTIPILEIIRNPKAYMSLFMIREEAFKLLNISRLERYLYSWNRDVFIPLGIMASLYLSIHSKSKKYIYLFMIIFLLGLINNSISVAKLPMASLFFSLVAFYFLKKGRFSLPFVFSGIITIFTIPVMINYFASLPTLRTPGKLLYGITNRLFVIPAEVLFEYFKIFPFQHPFLQGRSTQLFSWLHPDGNFNTANYVARVWWHDPATSGSANAVYIGNFWADFGIVGVIISTIIIGILMHYLYQRILLTCNYKKSMVYVVITTAFITHFTFSFISSSITVIMVTKGIIYIPIILYIVRNINITVKKVI